MHLWGDRLCLCQFLGWMDSNKYQCQQTRHAPVPTDTATNAFVLKKGTTKSSNTANVRKSLKATKATKATESAGGLPRSAVSEVAQYETSMVDFDALPKTCPTWMP